MTTIENPEIKEKPVKIPVKELTAAEKAKASQIESMKIAEEANKKIAARIVELKKFEGKTFVKNVNPGASTFKIIRYEGIGKNSAGVMSHLYRVEGKNPGIIWTPAATQFLEEHHEIEPKTETQNEVI